jgi:hypothetical protein
MTARPETKARPVRPGAGGPDFARLQRLATAAEPGVRDAFLRAVRTLRRGLDLVALEQALLAQDTEAVLRLVPLVVLTEALVAAEAALDAARLGAAEAAWRTAVRAIEAQRAALGPAERIGLSFDQQSPDVVAAFQRAGAARVREITDETRRALQQLVTRAYESGRHPRELAREISQLVGLTTRQEAAVARLRAALEAEGLTGARLERRVGQVARRLLRQRAETIAQTEANRAMNDGQRAAWSRLEAAGQLSPQQFAREWVTVLPAARVCKLCTPLDRARAPLGGTFPGGGGNGPPRHPRCRCTEVLVPVRRGEPS